MTIKQIQELLSALGYSPGPIDGLYGPLTQTAVKAFQSAHGLESDGIPGKLTQAALSSATAETPQETPSKAETGTFWDEIKYFTRAEFACQCGGKYCNGYPVEPDETLVKVIDEIRRRAGVPIGIIDDGGSGIRCTKHNAEVNGVSNSWHLYGKAADLHPHGISPEKLKAIAEEVTAEMIPGRGGIGIYKWGCHVDTGSYSRWDNR